MTALVKTVKGDMPNLQTLSLQLKGTCTLLKNGKNVELPLAHDYRLICGLKSKFLYMYYHK